MSAAFAEIPVDQADRDRVRTAHDVSIFVEAGAGTGKTRAIVDRVVAMVAAGRLQLRELAAITFTEAAASELRDRIRTALERAANGDDPLIVEPAARDHCARALDQVDETALTTLHGFAQRILAEHPLEAGLPPGFEVLDEIRARVEFEQRWAAFVDDLFDDETLAPALLRGLALGLSPALLHGVARGLHENHDLLPDAKPEDPSPALDAGPLRAALDHLLSLREHCTTDDDKLATHIDGKAALLRTHLGPIDDELDLIDLLRAAPKIGTNFGQAKCWGIDVKEVRKAAAEVDDAVAGIVTVQRRAVLVLLMNRVVEFVRASADARRRAGTLEFHDLLVLARDLLRRDADVRTSLARRYPHLLLDEFQDTDPIQIELAVLLTTDDPDAGSKPWPEITVRPGALVVVGDPKQSIYRFRRADLGMYHDAQRRLMLEQCTLVESFRSVPGVIEFVNGVFAELLIEEPRVQAAHIALHASRAAIGSDHPVGIFGHGVDANVGDVRAEEADDVAAMVRRIKDEKWLVDGEDGLREAAFADIALLIPSRTVLPALEDALERADIPVRVESQSLVFSTGDVRDLLAVLAAIDDPTDEIAVVSALRSPAFGCTDATLVTHVAAGGRWDYRRPQPESAGADHSVADGLAALRGYWEQRWWRSVSETLEAVVRDRHVLELALERRRPRDHWRRVRYLLDQARAWDDAGDASLRDFVEWVQEQADERARVSESVAPEPDNDALRILTVHGSKGLEFPIVILAGLNTTPPNPERPIVWTDAGPELRVGVKSRSTMVETDGYEASVAHEKEHEAAERLRLLYVAMTRARDYLVISLHHKANTDCHAKRLAEIVDAIPHTALEPRSGPAPRRARPQRRAAPASADPAERDRWLAARQLTLDRASRAASISATALAKAASPEAPPEPGIAEEALAEDLPPWRRGRAGTAVGRAVHAVLQTIDLDTGAGLEETARAQAFAEEVPNREIEIRLLTESVLASPVVRSALEPDSRYWREVPVAAAFDGLLVEGFIDLLIETPTGFVVVDYKTDRAPRDDDIDAATARYTPQGAAYALALEAVLGQPIARCVFVFARESGGAVEREVTDLAAAVTAVRDQVHAMA